jgi:methionyl-tRNA formyltransferase
VSRLIFAGTPDFALASLEALVESGHKPVAVLTQPDRPAGRGKKLRASPVKVYALEQDIPVLQPETLRDPEVVAALEALQPDLMIVAAYGLILPQQVLDIPTRGCVNVHASVLPRWRGAAPIQAAILAGDSATGISIMQMEAGLDTGPVFRIEVVNIDDTETAGELHDRLAELGGATLVGCLDDILAGTLEAEAQDEAQATYAPKIEKHDAEIDWSLSADAVARRVRAYNPFPGAFCFVVDPVSLDGTRLKVWQATPVAAVGTAGTILQADREGIVIACRNGALQLDVLQLPGKRRVPAHEFLGQLDLSGMRLD